MQTNKLNICVIGLGYVGLPLSIELAKKFKIIAFDTNSERIRNLKSFIDTNNEISSGKIRSVIKNVKFTSDSSDLINNNFYIITVPTPIDQRKKPDLKYLVSATKNVAKKLKKKRRCGL